ncbi:hypothetical protein FHS83_003076 [Rhizomicrobium palustre]|uniref:YeeE/YedE family protein n=1 Tax=Rhizomicrobium palustre TaxID=189966 RepID=A0A846N1E6_9PROT|nr:YeeE/YedE thiosulfate transporter family protein [Rhizomicrobium palustre]NIK89758.1 hypothetical protein [Rhizomicrobium palustre]
MPLSLDTVRESLLGGILIGTAAAGLLLVNGHIAGISGILGEALRRGAAPWRYAFLAGLIASPFAAGLIGIAPVVPQHQAGLVVLGLAGLLVGFGTRLSNGCTSGHGVCGLANFSPRSLLATFIFMAVAGVTVFVVRHVVPGL